MSGRSGKDEKRNVSPKRETRTKDAREAQEDERLAMVRYFLPPRYLDNEPKVSSDGSSGSGYAGEPSIRPKVGKSRLKVVPVPPAGPKVEKPKVVKSRLKVVPVPPVEPKVEKPKSGKSRLKVVPVPLSDLKLPVKLRDRTLLRPPGVDKDGKYIAVKYSGSPFDLKQHNPPSLEKGASKEARATRKKEYDAELQRVKRAKKYLEVERESRAKVSGNRQATPSRAGKPYRRGAAYVLYTAGARPDPNDYPAELRFYRDIDPKLVRYSFREILPRSGGVIDRDKILVKEFKDLYARGDQPLLETPEQQFIHAPKFLRANEPYVDEAIRVARDIKERFEREEITIEQATAEAKILKDKPMPWERRHVWTWSGMSAFTGIRTDPVTGEALIKLLEAVATREYTVGTWYIELLFLRQSSVQEEALTAPPVLSGRQKKPKKGDSTLLPKLTPEQQAEQDLGREGNLKGRPTRAARDEAKRIKAQEAEAYRARVEAERIASKRPKDVMARVLIPRGQRIDILQGLKEYFGQTDGISSAESTESSVMMLADGTVQVTITEEKNTYSDALIQTGTYVLYTKEVYFRQETILLNAGAEPQDMKLPKVYSEGRQFSRSGFEIYSPRPDGDKEDFSCVLDCLRRALNLKKSSKDLRAKYKLPEGPVSLEFAITLCAEKGKTLSVVVYDPNLKVMRTDIAHGPEVVKTMEDIKKFETMMTWKYTTAPGTLEYPAEINLLWDEGVDRQCMPHCQLILNPPRHCPYTGMFLTEQEASFSALKAHLLVQKRIRLSDEEIEEVAMATRAKAIRQSGAIPVEKVLRALKAEDDGVEPAKATAKKPAKKDATLRKEAKQAAKIDGSLEAILNQAEASRIKAATARIEGRPLNSKELIAAKMEIERGLTQELASYGVADGTPVVLNTKVPDLIFPKPLEIPEHVVTFDYETVMNHVREIVETSLSFSTPFPYPDDCWGKLGKDCSSEGLTWIEGVISRHAPDAKILLVGYNNSRFDNFILLPALCARPRLQKTKPRIVMANRTLLSIAWDNLVVKDLVRFTSPYSLKDLCEALKINQASCKTSFKHLDVQTLRIEINAKLKLCESPNTDGPEFWEKMEERFGKGEDLDIVKYNIQDCIATRECWNLMAEGLKKLHGLNMSEHSTLPQMAKAAWVESLRKAGGPKLDAQGEQVVYKEAITDEWVTKMRPMKKWLMRSREEYLLGREPVLGGRSDPLLEYLKICSTLGIDELDVVSLYVFIMAIGKFPIGAPVIFGDGFSPVGLPLQKTDKHPEMVNKAKWLNDMEEATRKATERKASLSEDPEALEKGLERLKLLRASVSEEPTIPLAADALFESYREALASLRQQEDRQSDNPVAARCIAKVPRRRSQTSKSEEFASQCTNILSNGSPFYKAQSYWVVTIYSQPTPEIIPVRNDDGLHWELTAKGVNSAYPFTTMLYIEDIRCLRDFGAEYIIEPYGMVFPEESNNLFGIVKHWLDVKDKATADGDDLLRTVSKMSGNSLSGKLAQAIFNDDVTLINGFIAYSKFRETHVGVKHQPLGERYRLISGEKLAEPTSFAPAHLSAAIYSLSRSHMYRSAIHHLGYCLLNTETDSVYARMDDKRVQHWLTHIQVPHTDVMADRFGKFTIGDQPGEFKPEFKLPILHRCPGRGVCDGHAGPDNKIRCDGTANFHLEIRPANDDGHLLDSKGGVILKGGTPMSKCVTLLIAGKKCYCCLDRNKNMIKCRFKGARTRALGSTAEFYDRVVTESEETFQARSPDDKFKLYMESPGIGADTFEALVRGEPVTLLCQAIGRVIGGDNQAIGLNTVFTYKQINKEGRRCPTIKIAGDVESASLECEDCKAKETKCLVCASADFRTRLAKRSPPNRCVGLGPFLDKFQDSVIASYTKHHPVRRLAELGPDSEPHYSTTVHWGRGVKYLRPISPSL